MENLSQKILFTIDSWKKKLLDLTKRNRALNFKPNKVSTVTIIDELPPQVFQILYLQHKSMKFQAQPESQTKDKEKTAGNEPLEESDDILELDAPIFTFDDELYEEDLPSPDFVPYDVATLNEKHTDDVLQTNAVLEKLDKSLRRLDEQARSALEEQGVNSLFLALGMLQYTESENSNETYKAPLILVPVELERRSALAGYTVKKTDDETIVNPSLIEYLRSNYGLTLPEIPDSSVIKDDYNLQTFFSDVTEIIKDQANWSVKNEIQLALFSFQKLVMYKDLEKNAKGLADHSIIKKIITRSGDNFAALPDDIRHMDLDRDFAPEATAQVVDADSSQLRAIAAVAKQHNLVLEGPPGTGKSQTITNLISQSLFVGKSVLFVAEKMAALDVVYRRLVSAGLGEFCLELHSTKANKRSVMNEIRKSLDASLQGFAVPQESSERLPILRDELTRYVNAVHTPYGNIGRTPYQAYGALDAVLHAPKVDLQNDIFSYTYQQIEDASRDARDLMITAEHVGSPAGHPWRDASKTFYPESDLDQITACSQSLIGELAKATELNQKIEGELGLPSVHKLTDIETVAAIASVIARTPGAPIQVLESEAWNIPPAQATGLIERGRNISGVRVRILQNFTIAVFEHDPGEEVAYIEGKSSGFFSFLAFLDGRYRFIRKKWMALRSPSFQSSLLEQAEEMKYVTQYLGAQKALAAEEANGRALFGNLWQGEASDFSKLEGYISWVLDFRRICIQHGLREKAMIAASTPGPNLGVVASLEKSIGGIRKLLNELILLTELPANYFDEESLESIKSRVSELHDNIGLAAKWASFEEIKQRFAKSAMGELLLLAMNGSLSFKDLSSAFKRAFYQKWLAQVVTERTELRSFHTLTHEQRIKEFQEKDKKVLKENQASLVALIRDRLQDKLREPELKQPMGFLQSQLARQRGLAPLRTTMKQAISAIRAIKPCFMMSPQTVAQFLEVETSNFDLVIFDEASQLPTEEAVGAILRSTQLVVVGDPKQLPPTNFFSVQNGSVNIKLGDDGLPLYEDSQSILEEVMAAGVPQTRLKWHYRSAHESLIAFSNIQFYESDLYTFPSVETNSLDSGLHFEYVENGIYEGKGLNLVEARRVADAVVEHIKTEPELSLGIGTFNMRQQLAIQDELEQRRRDDQSIEFFFDKSRYEPFFVKNLENIQGDEREVIFLSVTYAKATDGKMRYNLGPLNGENGGRRLNVLTTRARKLMRVFSSIRGDEINPISVTSNGARLLKEFLSFAEHKKWEGAVISTINDTDSPFEREVFYELDKRGFKVVPQVGVCGYKIDLGILDPELPGRFICGIECDGVAYHSSETARDRDRLRQQVLEGRGWDIHRVWSTDWFKDRKGQIERLTSLIDRSRENARTSHEEEKESAKRKKEEADKHFRNILESNSVENVAARDLNYIRPVAAPYIPIENENVFYGQLLEAPIATLAKTILEVAEKEAPIHMKDLASRVASMWCQKSGANILSRITQVAQALQDIGHLEIRGDFVWRASGEFLVRSRSGTNIPAERIAPEEIKEAILQVLKAGHGFGRQDLINETRAVFGFSRTGPSLLQVIDKAIENLLSDGIIGEGSLGIALRKI